VSDIPTNSLRDYADLLGHVKSRIRQAQSKAILAANAEMIRLYWDIGRLVAQQQQLKGWGSSVIPRLARDIRNDLPEVKGFSERNIGYMIRFAREYPILQPPAAKLLPDPTTPILQTPAAKLPGHIDTTTLQQVAFQLPWFHNVLLMEKVKDLPTRL
jgi:hypothetical protein